MSNIIVETSINSETKAIVTYKPVGEMEVSFSPIANAFIEKKEQPVVFVNLVYTATVTEGLEVWWCDNWKMLWNNQTRVLWRTE